VILLGCAVRPGAAARVLHGPDYMAKKTRLAHLYAIVGGPGDPAVLFGVDGFGPLNLQPHRGSGRRHARDMMHSPA
jgi:hypothetical protein